MAPVFPALEKSMPLSRLSLLEVVNIGILLRSRETRLMDSVRLVYQELRLVITDKKGRFRSLSMCF